MVYTNVKQLEIVGKRSIDNDQKHHQISNQEKVYPPVFYFRQPVGDDATRGSGADHHEVVLLALGNGPLAPSVLEYRHKCFVEQMIITFQKVFGPKSCRGGPVGRYVIFFGEEFQRRSRWPVHRVPEQVHQEPEEHEILRLTRRNRFLRLHAHLRHVFGRKLRRKVFRHIFVEIRSFVSFTMLLTYIHINKYDLNK